jgi:hypothetical protein
MKTMNHILISLAISLLFFNNNAVANNYNPTVKVEGNKLYLSLENVSEQTSIRILDPKGFTWIEEKVTVSGQFKKVFDLGTLPIGSYNLIIKSNFKEIVQPLTISSKELIMDENNRAEYFQAKLLQKRANVKLSLLNPTNSDIRVIVINMQGRKVFQESIKDQRIIDINYNLKQLPKGKYTILVDNAHEVFTKIINL